MKPLGEMQKAPKKAVDPKVELQSPSRALNQHSHELHDPPEKAAIATRWQAEHSIPAQAAVPGRKTQSWQNNAPLPWATLLQHLQGHPSALYFHLDNHPRGHILPLRSEVTGYSENLRVSAFPH